ncbi:Hypothetical predicted protein, partial [Olea europaea subsp. europaea]
MSISKKIADIRSAVLCTRDTLAGIRPPKTTFLDATRLPVGRFWKFFLRFHSKFQGASTCRGAQ